MRTGPRVRAFGLTVLPVAALLVLSAAFSRAQTIPPPRDVAPRATPSEPLSGHASLSGQVRTTDDRPLRGAVVVLRPIDGQALGVTTDGDGRYRFDNVSAGRYTLQASKPAYIEQGYGSRRPGGTPRIMALSDDSILDNLDIVVMPGCVLSGRVLDPSGEPLDKAMIRVMRYACENGKKRLTSTFSSGTFSTKELGEFRIYGLPPGEYYLAASLLQMSMATEESGQRVGYPTTFYPGTVNPSQAARLSCAPGRELGQLEFALQQARAYKVEGVVRDASGKPVSSGTVMLSSSDGMGSSLSMAAPFGSDGRFTIHGVLPGEYRIQADATLTAEVAVRPLTVTGDISGLSLSLNPGGQITGRIVPDTGLTFDFPLSTVNVSAESSDSGGGLALFARGRAKDDGTFEVTRVRQPVLLRVSPPRKWRVKAIRLNGADIRNQAVDPTARGAVTGVEVILTNRSSTVVGTARDENGQPGDDYVVFALSDDPAARPGGLDGCAYARSDQDGHYRLEGLPPGVYRVAAIRESDQPEELGNPEWLQALAARAMRIRVSEGESLTLDLRLIRLTSEQPEARQ